MGEKSQLAAALTVLEVHGLLKRVQQLSVGPDGSVTLVLTPDFGAGAGGSASDADDEAAQLRAYEKVQFGAA